MRNRVGHRRLEMADARSALADNRMWCAMGVVVKRDQENEHFEIINDDSGNPADVVVEVDIMPRREAVTARLAAVSGGPGAGLWKVPPVGAEVLVAIPMGQLEGGAIIVGVLSCQNVPGALDTDKMVLINPGDVILASKNGKVYLGSEDGSGTKKVAFKDSEVNMGSFQLNGVGTAFSKITWTPPGGGSPIDITVSPGTELTGKVSEGSDTTEVKP